MKIVDLFEELPMSKRREYGKKVTKSFDDAAAAFLKYKPKIQPAIEAYARSSVIWRGVPAVLIKEDTLKKLLKIDK